MNCERGDLRPTADEVQDRGEQVGEKNLAPRARQRRVRILQGTPGGGAGAAGAGLCSPGSRRGLDHQPRQEVPRDTGTTAWPALDLSAATGERGCHLRGVRGLRRGRGPASPAEGKGHPGKLRSMRGSKVQPAARLDGASVYPSQRRLGCRGPRLALRARTCPAAASPAPPASAPASRPRRAGSRIPMGARGAHTDRTGPRAACQACPSRDGGGRVAGALAQPAEPPEPPAPSSPVLDLPCTHFPVWAKGGGGVAGGEGQSAGTPPHALPRDHPSPSGWLPAARSLPSQLPP